MKGCRTCDAASTLRGRRVDCSWCAAGEAPWVAGTPPEVARAFAEKAAREARDAKRRRVA